MNRHLCISLLGCGLILTVVAGQDVQKPPVPNHPTTDEPGIQVENRGPVHEAFANPGAAIRGEKEGFTAPKAPPPPIPELPPDEKPEGNNIQWIPGYWQFDQEKKDFLWVSGFWRNTPPGRAWSPGEWRVENGTHRYIPGYWKPSNENSWRIDLPKPPESVEAGPNVPAPHKDAHWIPGHWVLRDENYAWRPGYWGEIEEDMLWTPSQYLYTGSGYRFVPGYWDYCFEDRGLLYAPVYFTSPLWLNPRWRYCPSFGISIGFGGGWGWGYGGFYDNLYMGPGFGSFWFGNFGGPGYWGAGFRPWCWTGGRGFCNPVFNNYCWLNRGNNGWRHNLQQNYAARSLGVLPGAGRQVARNNFNRSGNINPGTLNNATQLVRKIGGEQAARNLTDRVNKGQMIQQANRAVKQASSNTMVQPAKEVLRNQTVARNLPAPNAAKSGDIAAATRQAALNSSNKINLNTMKGNSRPSYAGSETVLRNNINHAVRTAPSGSITRAEGNTNLPRSTNSASSRNMGGLEAIRGSSRSLENTARGSSGGSVSTLSRGSLPPSSTGRGTFNPPSTGSVGRSTSSPTMGETRSMPSTGGVRSSPSMGATRSMPSTGGIRSAPSMGSAGRSMGGGSMGGARGGSSGGGARGGGGKR